MNRRMLLRLLGAAASAAPLAGALPPGLPLLNGRAQAAGRTPARFLQIFMRGGWDAALTTDPVPGPSHAKAGSGYERAYWDPASAAFQGAPAAPSGKSRLLVGPGLAALRPHLADVPTAFVNGLFVEVTAHELAVNYLLSGQLSLSRSREYPAFIARAAQAAGGFPAHVVLGAGVPLGETAQSAPPLQCLNADTYVKMLAGPYGGDLKEETIDAAHALLEQLNQGFRSGLPPAALDGLDAWAASESGLVDLYAKDYASKIKLTDAARAEFHAGAGDDSFGALLAVAFQSLREGVTRFCTVSKEGFDTHRSHLEQHRPLLDDAAAAIGGLLTAMQSAPDPDSPSLKLIETTTILVTSEFNRTPLFNASGGTDHWQTGNAILIGRGVKDGTVIGATDATGAAADYDGAKLLPDHLAASLLRVLGYADEADKISKVNLSELFA